MGERRGPAPALEPGPLRRGPLPKREAEKGSDRFDLVSGQRDKREGYFGQKKKQNREKSFLLIEKTKNSILVNTLSL